ncbi:MAG: hypothetical protein H0T65_25350 [Deltaproteobacteria bacterium]|nr:hypothetical protein [Deltaproteobacteria bacterium]
MSTATEPVITLVLDLRAQLRRVDARIVALRRALGHDHRDEPFWTAFGVSASAAQAQRAMLRKVADVLHVERATQRDRVHGGTRFATLDEQRAWLAADARYIRRRIVELLDICLVGTP